MEFKEIDLQFYERKMEEMVPMEKKLKKFKYALLICLITFLVGLCLNVFLPAITGNIILVIVIVISLFSMSGLLVQSMITMKDMKPYWKMMKLFKNPAKIMIFPDFHVEVYDEKGNKTSMHTIQSVKRNYYKSIMTVEYKYRNDDTNYFSTYEISYCMKNLSTIEKLLKFKIELQHSQKFVNSAMKKIFHMAPSIRNRLFVEELNSGELLLPIRLLEMHETSELSMNLFNDIYVTYECDERGFVSMYTSVKEISEETRQAYPQCLHVKTERVYGILKQYQSSVFKEKDAGIIINKNEEKVQVHSMQLDKIMHVDARNNAKTLYDAM